MRFNTDWPVLLLGLSSSSFAFQLHGQEVVRARLDPIVNPGVVSGHTHSIFGGSNFGPVVTSDGLAQSKCTTVFNTVDKSTYWTPPPYGRNRDGTFTALRNVLLNIYYRVSDNAPVTGFPKDFRMLVGNPGATSFSADPFTGALTSYQCQNYIPAHDITGKWDFISAINAFPDVNCTRLQLSVTFPNCWDGVNADSPNHRSHVAYGSGPVCPPSHLKRIPQITFEAVYFTDDYDIKDIFLSTGDNKGYSIHADFAFGWENDGAELNAAMKDPTCQKAEEVDPSLPEDFGDGICKTLSPFYNKEAGTACAQTISAQISQEEVGIERPVPSLPGCNPLWGGPGLPSKKPTCDAAPQTPALGNPSKIFSWEAVPRAKVGPVSVAVYEGFNPAPAPPTTPVPTTPPSGPASGTIFLTTGDSWDGKRATWPWTNGGCKTLVSPYLKNLGSAGPNAGTCTFFSEAHCQGTKLFTFGYPGQAGLGTKGDQVQSFKCV